MKLDVVPPRIDCCHASDSSISHCEIKMTLRNFWRWCLQKEIIFFFPAGKSEASVGLNLLCLGSKHFPGSSFLYPPAPPQPPQKKPSELVIADLQIVLWAPARRLANSVCRLLEAIRAGPGSRLGVLKVIGRIACSLSCWSSQDPCFIAL